MDNFDTELEPQSVPEPTSYNINVLPLYTGTKNTSVFVKRGTVFLDVSWIDARMGDSNTEARITVLVPNSIAEFVKVDISICHDFCDIDNTVPFVYLGSLTETGGLRHHIFYSAS